ncbi:MAG TPA: amidohydrolase [Bacteroidota bacterium]|nr:amidohydrolase [Bacteroidota bacterium]
MNQKVLGIIFISISIITFYYLINTTMNDVDSLLINGRAYTFDAGNNIAEAIAIRGDRIVGIGSTYEMMKRYSTKNVVDLQGKTVLPGFIDAHAHLLGEGGKLATLDLVGTSSAEQIISLVEKRVGESSEGQWIIGRGWDQNDWAVKQFPDRSLLDRVAQNNPVSLRRIDGHALWVNSKTLALANITTDTKDPFGGKIHRDEKENPTGILIDNAMDLVGNVMSDITSEEIEERLKLALEECARLGLTEVHDMGVDLETIEIYKKIIDSGQCPIRVYAAIGDHEKTLKHYLQHGTEIGYGNGLLTVRAVKLYIDGALGSRGAALIDEYLDDPGNRGLTVMSESQIESICNQALEKGFQVCSHAIGDRGNNIALNSYEKILTTLSKNRESPRWRIEHVQVLLPADIARFKQLGILPSMQPTHATSDMYWAESRIGSDRIKSAYAWRSLLRTGSIIISGSDFPVEGVNPLWGFYAAITRSDQTGYPQDGWYPDQKMTREEAVRSFTQWAAYGAFEEHLKGTIEVGKWADLTILSKDIMQIPPSEILTTEVEMTIVGGKFVYQKPVVPVPQ